ncbi:MAG: hypothetical protein NT075_25880, partial [Chloroflexi bacterium]|nr:hypothetical protein [Chloroflexota bacterium]
METQHNVSIHLEKPRLGLPVSLVVDDGVPGINPLYYFYLQVPMERHETHEPNIPLDLIDQFAEIAQRQAIRGKFTVLPYPAGLGTILEGWEGCDRQEIARWLDVVRSAIAPQFDITPEILTHTLALDLRTHTLIPEAAEHIWMADRTQAELTEYMRTSVDILRQADFAPTGITQPCYFNGDRAAYAQAVLGALRPDAKDPDGTVVFYFVDFLPEDPPLPPSPVVVLDRDKGEAVVSILCNANDYFWNTQYASGINATQAADKFITADGQAGRLVDLIRGDAWAVLVTHWQSLYSNGSRQGLAGLDEVASRLARTYGPRLLWMTNSQIARYRVAEESTQITLLDGETIQLDATFACPDFTFTLQSPTFGADHINGVELVQPGNAHALVWDATSDGQMPSTSW